MAHMSGTENDLKVLRSDLTQLREDMSKITETLQALARHGSDEALNKVRDTSERLREQVKSKTDSLTHQIEEKPVAAAMTSFAIGMILGALIGGRRS